MFFWSLLQKQHKLLTLAPAGPLLHVQETAAPPTVGVPVVLVKKATVGAVPDMPDTCQAQELMPFHLHLTYLLPNTYCALHAVFKQVGQLSDVLSPANSQKTLKGEDHYSV